MQVDGGKALLESLRNVGFDVTVSGWTKSSEEGDWHLYIASTDVEWLEGVPAKRRTEAEGVIRTGCPGKVLDRRMAILCDNQHNDTVWQFTAAVCLRSIR